MSFFEPLIEIVDEDMHGYVPQYKPPTFEQQERGSALFKQYWDQDLGAPSQEQWRLEVEPKLQGMRTPEGDTLPEDWREQYHDSGWYQTKLIDIAYQIFFGPASADASMSLGLGEFKKPYQMTFLEQLREDLEDQEHDQPILKGSEKGNLRYWYPTVDCGWPCRHNPDTNRCDSCNKKVAPYPFTQRVIRLYQMSEGGYTFGNDDLSEDEFKGIAMMKARNRSIF